MKRELKEAETSVDRELQGELAEEPNGQGAQEVVGVA